MQNTIKCYSWPDAYHRLFKKIFFFSISFIPCRQLGLPYVGRASVAVRAAAARAVLPIPNSACSIFMCPNKGMAAMLGTFNMHLDVKACVCTQGLYGHRKRVCTESCHWEKNPLPHQEIEPASVACQSDTLPTELHPLFDIFPQVK